MKCTECKTALPNDTNVCPNCSKVNDTPSTGYQVAMWIFSILGGFIGIALAASIVFGNLPDGNKRYTKKSRTTATIALIVGVIVLATARALM